MALACAVLVASALLVRSVTRMMQAPTGVQSAGVVTGTLQIEGAKYQQWPNVEQFYASWPMRSAGSRASRRRA